MNISDYSLITNNCATVWFLNVHESGTPYATPLVGSHIPDDEQFLRLCVNWDYYSALTPAFGPPILPIMVSQAQCPVMYLGDVQINWVHEEDPDEVLAKWTRRLDRSRSRTPFFYWADYYLYRPHSDEDRERIIADFLTIPEHQRAYSRKEDIPAWRDLSFASRAVNEGWAQILQWGNNIELVNSLILAGMTS
jgi:uncharacterized protein (DUF1919 family)